MPKDICVEVRMALWNYHNALDTRQNGDVAAHKFAKEVEKIFGIPWEPGVTLQPAPATITFLENGEDEMGEYR